MMEYIFVRTKGSSGVETPHVLFTLRGMYFRKTATTSIANKRASRFAELYGPEGNSLFIGWTEVKKIGKQIFTGKVTVIGIKLVRVNEFESEENFKERKMNFKSFLLPVVAKECERWLEENKNNPEVKAKKISKVEKRLAK